MQIARVIGTVVATQKHAKFDGAKLLLVQPIGIDDAPRGPALLAIDGVGAGVHEKVLVVLEGRAAGEALGKKAAPVDAAIIGIIDQVDVHEISTRTAALVRDAIAGTAARRNSRSRFQGRPGPSLRRQSRTTFAGGG
jgi:ethanolamine utilization protein EutN